MNSQELLVFEVSGRSFSVPLAVVEEVVPASAITGIPASPPFLLGLAAVRGKVMAVIDAARRYGLPRGPAAFFVVCHVRGNLTAVAVDRAVVAGEVATRELNESESRSVREQSGVNEKFLRGAFELREKMPEQDITRATGHFFLAVDPDLFVSAEMASRVGEAA